MNTPSRSESSPAPTVVRCESPADFLASLPVLLGYVPEDSIVLTLFEGSQAKSAARFDLPQADVPLESTQLDRAMLELIEQHPWVSAVALVAYCSDSFANQPGAPHALLAMWLERALEMHGTPVRELACVASDGWAVYRSSEASSGGNPLSEIAHSQFVKRKGLTGFSPPEPLRELGSLPHPQPKLASALRQALARAETVPPKALTADHMQAMLQQCHQALSEGLSPGTAQETASFVHTCSELETWLTPVLLIAAGGVGEPLTVDDDLAQTFLEFVQDDAKTTRPTVVKRLKLFSSERLEPSQLRATVQTLTEVAAHTPDALRPGVLALAAWAWWMGGMTTPAITLLREAAGIDPHQASVTIVQELCESGPPLWAFSDDTR
ncbi:MAG: DUF4192 family protein [Microbacteriaceae bacterium]